eukprot:2063100-Pyramimonas_sp.AAC.1
MAAAATCAARSRSSTETIRASWAPTPPRAPKPPCTLSAARTLGAARAARGAATHSCTGRAPSQAP